MSLGSIVPERHLGQARCKQRGREPNAIALEIPKMQFHPKCQKTTRFWRDGSPVPLVKRLSEPPATTAKVLEFHPVREPQIVFSSFLAQRRIATWVGREKKLPMVLPFWNCIFGVPISSLFNSFIREPKPGAEFHNSWSCCAVGRGLVSSRIRACTIASSFRRISLAMTKWQQQSKERLSMQQLAKIRNALNIPKQHTFWSIGKPLAGHPG